MIIPTDGDSLYISVFDIISVTLSLLMFTAYYIHFYLVSIGSGPKSTQLRKNIDNVGYWSMKHFYASDSTATTTLAVQTLRNSIVAAIFIGGSALSTVSVVIQPMFEYWSPRLAVRQLILSILLTISFLNWALVIRYNTHAGFMAGAIHPHLKEKVEKIKGRRLNALLLGARRDRERKSGDDDDDVGVDVDGRRSVEEEEEEKEEEQVVQELARNFASICELAVVHQAWGFRYIFFSIPFFFYTAGPLALLVSSVAMILFLVFFHDYPMILSSAAEAPAVARISYRKAVPGLLLASPD
jgi:uncharacterized membrane protein